MSQTELESITGDPMPAFAKAGIARIATTMISALSYAIFSACAVFQKRAFPGITSARTARSRGRKRLVRLECLRANNKPWRPRPAHRPRQAGTGDGRVIRQRALKSSYRERDRTPFPTSPYRTGTYGFPRIRLLKLAGLLQLFARFCRF